jgi:hypothetical protein
VECLAGAWEHAPWPPALLSTRFLASTDGETVLTYSQWANDEGYDIFVRSNANCKADQRECTVPGVGGKPPLRYRLYRSLRRDNLPAAPGCVVIVSVEFDGRDKARQRRWIDTVVDALDAEPELHPGRSPLLELRGMDN